MVLPTPASTHGIDVQLVPTAQSRVSEHRSTQWAVAERAGTVAAVLVDRALGAGRCARSDRDAAGEQVALRIAARDLAGQPCGALGLAGAEVADLAGRGDAQAVLAARIAVTALGRALAERNAGIRDALEISGAVAAVGAAVPDAAATLAPSGD
jgi:hypothetical protein